MRYILNQIAVTLLSLAFLATITMDPAYARSPSSFQDSCSSVLVGGNVLYANCTPKNAPFGLGAVGSSVVLKGIWNDNGTLRDDGSDKPASFHLTCVHSRDNPQIRYGNTDQPAFPVDGDVLKAYCRRKDGSWTETSIHLTGIRNDNGQLKY